MGRLLWSLSAKKQNASSLPDLPQKAWPNTPPQLCKIVISQSISLWLFYMCLPLGKDISCTWNFLSIISISEHRWAVTVTFIVWILGCLWEKRTLHSPVRLCICALIAPDFSQVSQSLAFQQWNITVSLTSASTKISWKYFYIFLKEKKKTPPTYILDSLKWSPWV